MINELMEKKQLSKEENDFLNLHQKALLYSQAAYLNFVELSKALKEISDKDLFRMAGYEKFEDYSFECFGLKKSQAYNFLKIANTFSDSFMLENKNCGISKMIALSKLEDENLASIVISNVDLENTKVKNLEVLVKNLKKEKDNLMKENKNLTSLNEEKIKQLESDLKKSKDNCELLEKRISENQNMAEENQNSDYVRFTILFGEFQQKFNSMLSCLEHLDDDNKTSCKKSIFTILSKMQNKL